MRKPIDGMRVVFVLGLAVGVLCLLGALAVSFFAVGST